jgi:hypothetical protein
MTRRLLMAVVTLALLVMGAGAASASTHSSTPTGTFRVELVAWIPQRWVVDPTNPGAKQPCNSLGCAQNGPQNPGETNCLGKGTLSESVFAGNNHNGFNDKLSSGQDKGEVWTSFQTSANTFSHIGEQIVVATTHRYEEINGGTSHCVQSVKDTAGLADNVQVNSSDTDIRLTIVTINYLGPAVGSVAGPGNATPPIHAIVDITVNNGTLTFTYKTGQFPSIAISVTRNYGTSSAVQDTDIVNNVACLNQGDVLGFTGLGRLLFGLGSYPYVPGAPDTTAFPFGNTGTLTMDSASGPGIITGHDSVLCASPSPPPTVTGTSSTPAPKSFAEALAAWKKVASLPATETASALEGVAGDLTPGADPGGDNIQITDLNQLATYPLGGGVGELPAPQAANAGADIAALDTFFNTPGYTP